MKNIFNKSPNSHLIGHINVRSKLQTPALIVDLDILERNIKLMSDFSVSRSVALRPHAKTHKSIEIAQLQIAAGAIGVCTATLGEAETLASGNIRNILITSPIVGNEKISRFLNLCRHSPEVLVVVDSIDNVFEMEKIASSRGQVVNALVAIDIGTKRIGAFSNKDGVTLVRYIDESKSFKFLGIHAYAGNLQHIESYVNRKTQARLAHQKIQRLTTKLGEYGLQAKFVSGAGTGTHEIDGESSIYTELQVGSYIFMDAEYRSVEMRSSQQNPFCQSLFIATTVISNNHRGFSTTDAGSKWFSMDGAPPIISCGAPIGSIYDFQGDEHGKVVFPNKSDELKTGNVLEVIPPHCDPTVNLYEHYHVFRGERLVDIWNIQARGVI